MRARYLVRDMANGDPEAWRLAETKVSRPNLHAGSRKLLTDAMATLPRPDESPQTDDSERYALTIYAGDDWQQGTPAKDIGFEIVGHAQAVSEAYREMWRLHCLGTPRHQLGAYVHRQNGPTTGPLTLPF